MEEAMIPVFSVLKKGTMLKNIFLNRPPPETGKALSPSRDNDPILIGRHPDCHIVVDHPSISRFHLEIRPNSTLQQLFVTDRSSVHGTWVSGRKIQPNIPTELIEGDTVKLGASTRIYRLHWMPLSHAFEMEKPMSPLIEEASDFKDNDEVFQDENLNEVWVNNVIPSAPPMPEIMKASSPGKLCSPNLEREGQNLIPSAPPMPEIMKASSPGKLCSQNFEREGPNLIGKEVVKQSSCFSSIVPLLESVSSSCPLEEENEDSQNFLANEMQPEAESEGPIPLRSGQKAKSSSLLSRRNKSISFLQIEKTSKENNSMIRNIKEDLETEEQMIGAFAGGYGEEKKIPLVLLTEGDVKAEEEESFVSDKENMTPVNSIGSKVLKSNRGIERSLLRTFSIFNKDDLEIEEHEIGAFAGGNGEEIPLVLLAEGDVNMEKEETFVSDKENMTPVNSICSKVLKRNRGIERSPLSSFSLFNTNDLKIEEHKVGAFARGNREEKIHFVPLADDDVREDQEGFFISDKEKLTPVNSIGSKALKNNRGIERSPPNSFSLDDLVIEEQKVGFYARVKGARKSPSVFLAEVNVSDTFVSDKDNMTLVRSSDSKVLRSNREIETSSLSSFSTFNFEEEPSNSDKENPTSESTKHLSTRLKSGSRLMKGKKDPIFSDAHNLEILSPGIKLQRNLFKLDQSPLGEKKVLNVEGDMFLSDKENWTPDVPKSLKTEKAFARDLLKAEREENETFASDKENLTPQNSMSIKSKKVPSQSNGRTEGETMRRRKERIPFQPLFMSSPLRNSSSASYKGLDETCFDNYVDNVHNLDKKVPDHKKELPHMPGSEKKKWYMVVDVGCFLTEESRKSLQLLEGIKGTQLIIPRIVIRELDHLKRCQGRLIGGGAKAFSVLQWIEECMVKTSWWIHVQSSSETFPAAPTPPATPRSQLCDGSSGFGSTSSNFTGFSTCGSLMEIVSPTAEDHILDCALLFKRIKDDGQLMLLTSSTTLRIKAMAEGLLCESPKEFRESLVNPFSNRFMWTDSSPRGSTWSCLEEVGLPENFYQQLAAAGRMTKAGGGTVKGLKLILLHS